MKTPRKREHISASLYLIEFRMLRVLDFCSLFVYPHPCYLFFVAKFKGMVEKWLIQVEEIMIKSLMKVTEDALLGYSQTPRDKWVQEWPGQVTLDTMRFPIVNSLIIRTIMLLSSPLLHEKNAQSSIHCSI